MRIAGAQSALIFVPIIDRPDTGLNPFESGIPNKFVNLKTQSGRNVVGQNPLSQIPRVHEAVRRVPGAVGFLAKSRGKEYRVYLTG